VNRAGNYGCVARGHRVSVIPDDERGEDVTQASRKLIPAAAIAAVGALLAMSPIVSSVVAKGAGKPAKKTARVNATLSATRNLDGSVTARAVLSSKRRACIRAADAKTNISRASGVIFDLPGSLRGVVPAPPITATEVADTVSLVRVGPRTWEAVVPASHPLHYNFWNGMTNVRRTAAVSQAIQATVFADLGVRREGPRQAPYVYTAKGVTCRGNTSSAQIPL
jgi:hypothetical protein